VYRPARVRRGRARRIGWLASPGSPLRVSPRFGSTTRLFAFFAKSARNALVPGPRPIGNLQRAFDNDPITWASGISTREDLARDPSRMPTSMPSAPAPAAA
jgi:hypothetical protein